MGCGQALDGIGRDPVAGLPTPHGVRSLGEHHELLAPVLLLTPHGVRSPHRTGMSSPGVLISQPLMGYGQPAAGPERAGAVMLPTPHEVRSDGTSPWATGWMTVSQPP